MPKRTVLSLSWLFLVFALGSSAKSQGIPNVYVKATCESTPTLILDFGCPSADERFYVVARGAQSSGPNDSEPSPSPDGTRVAFTRRAVWSPNATDTSDIYVMNLKDGAVTRLTQGGNNGGSAWSPTGTQIAFVSNRDGHSELYLMNPDGSNVARLTYNVATFFGFPTWSPDGRRIAFTCTNRDGLNAYTSKICVINADGSGLVQLAVTQNFSGLSWSPDGTKFAFIYNPSDLENSGISTINVDGSGLQSFNLTNGSFDRYLADAKWAPDGRTIAFVTFDFDSLECVQGCIWTMGTDGSNRIRVLSHAQQPAGFVVTAPGVATPQTGWWADPKLGGIGFFIEYGGKSGGGLFIAGAGYDAYGGSLWLVSTGPLTGPTYSGTWLLAKDGGSFSQRAGGHLSLTPAGNFSIQFTDASHAVMTRTDGSQINLQRFSFTASQTPAPPESGTPQAGWWWPERNADGNAYAIEIQNDSVFIAAFSYGDFGDPFWCLASGSLTSPTSFSGGWDFFEGGPQFNAPEGTYAAHKDAFAVAPMTLTFTDATHATMTYKSGSTEISIPIGRFQEF